MNPAYSIILFTTASGLGYGMMAIVGLYTASQAMWTGNVLPTTVMIIGLVLVAAGLLSSTFHLGHPERAWRALSQWRSSWLSREGVLAVVTFVPAVVLTFAWWTADEPSQVLVWAGACSAILCAFTVFSTSMIYASLKAIPRWHTPWVPVLYLLLAGMTGALWVAALVNLFGERLEHIGGIAAVLIAVAATAKAVYWRSGNFSNAVSTVESATGLGDLGGRAARATLLAPPHTEPNFLQKEMGYRIAQTHATRLREHAFLMAFAIPIMLTLFTFGFGGEAGRWASVLAAISATYGVVVERWLFFAEAEHKVSLYYGQRSI